MIPRLRWVKLMEEPKVRLIEKLVGEDYRECYEIASSLYSDEQARQACCATLMIQYSQIRKSNVKLAEALRMLEQARQGLEHNTVVRENMTWEDVKNIYNPLVSSYPKVGKYIDSLSEMNLTFSEIDSRVRDYMHRNGFDFTFSCQLIISADATETTTNGGI